MDKKIFCSRWIQASLIGTWVVVGGAGISLAQSTSHSPQATAKNMMSGDQPSANSRGSSGPEAGPDHTTLSSQTPSEAAILGGVVGGCEDEFCHLKIQVAQSSSTPTGQIDRILQPPSLEPQPEPSPPAPLPPPSDLLPSIPSPTPENPDLPDAPANIRVSKFKIVGSTVFSEADFDRLTQSFRDRNLTLAELFQVRDAVTKLYVDNGYITTGAYIPPQRLTDSVVEIRVVEGSLEDIKVSGTRRLDSSYIRKRVALGTKTPLNRNQLLEALQVLRLNPLIENLSAELSTGSRPGKSLLEVQVAEADSVSTSVVFDNGRSPSVGTNRLETQFTTGNLTGMGDSLQLSFAFTRGSNELNFGYTVPINARNGTIGVNFGISNSNVIEEPFDVLDIESKSSFFELTLRQPFVQTPTEDFAMGLTFGRRSSEATILGEVPFPAPGADLEGKTKITTLRFFQEWSKRSSQAVLAARSQLTFGLNALGSNISDEPPDSRFVAWRGQMQWVRLLAPDTLLLLRGDLQFANKNIFPVEQFGIGGQSSVRGYRQDFLLTDNGFLGSAEVRIPIWRLPKVPAILHLTPFIEFGTGWNSSNRPDPDPRTLASVGLGLRLQVSNTLNARLDWGIPLISTDTERRTWQEKGLYFSIIYSPF